MWDNLRIRERERGLGILFVSILAAVFGFSLLALGFPDAAKAAGFAFLGIFWAFAVRRLRGLRRSKPQVTPVGPLSPDEKRKARSKLQPSGRQLVTAAQRYFYASGAAYAEVITQGRNQAALDLYLRCGFHVVNTQHWYHLHV